MTAPAEVLAVRGLTKRFPGVLALDEVTFSVRAGEVHALVGENGAGKSTLIKVLTGVYHPDQGELRYQGEPAAFGTPLAAQQAGISTIYQEVNLVPLMSVARNLFLGREPRNRLRLVDFPRMHREAGRVLRDHGVDVDVRQPLRNLGVGAQQMVALARAVSVDARVVIMDEPTSAGTPGRTTRAFESREVRADTRAPRGQRAQAAAVPGRDRAAAWSGRRMLRRCAGDPPRRPGTARGRWPGSRGPRVPGAASRSSTRRTRRPRPAGRPPVAARAYDAPGHQPADGGSSARRAVGRDLHGAVTRVDLLRRALTAFLRLFTVTWAPSRRQGEVMNSVEHGRASRPVAYSDHGACPAPARRPLVPVLDVVR